MMALAFQPQLAFHPRLHNSNASASFRRREKVHFLFLYSQRKNGLNIIRNRSNNNTRVTVAFRGETAMAHEAQAPFPVTDIIKTTVSMEGKGPVAFNGSDNGASVDEYVWDLLRRMDRTIRGQLHFSHCKKIHQLIIAAGLEQNMHLGSKLISMYAACGSVEDARQVFYKITDKRSVVLWTAMINSYARNGFHEKALALYFEMKRQGIQPNHFTFSTALKACAGLCALEQGKVIHVDIVKRGFMPYVVVGSALVDMYAKCERIEDARHVFDRMPERDVVSWNTIISGFAQNGMAIEATTYLHRMLDNDVKPNINILASVLTMCRRSAALNWGREIHAQVVKSVLESDVFVGTALVAMYAQCKRLEVARRVYDRISGRNEDLWNSMISAYSQNGCAIEGLKLFCQIMHQNAVKPNPATIEGVLSACGYLASVKQGKEIHCYVLKNKLESNVFVSSALIDMYAKCGRVDVACRVFDKKTKRDVISWTAMIAGYGMSGDGKKAIKCFHQMQKVGLKPNSVTFVALLSACRNAGLVIEGRKYFNSMSQNYYIKPRVEHYECMVDLLGRAGRLTDALDLIQNMTVEPNSSVWEALLGSCRMHCNVELGEKAAEHLFEINPENARYYILLSNIYAEAGRWNDVERVRKMMKDRGIQPWPGLSSIEVKSEVYSFMVLMYLSLLPRKSIFVLSCIVLLRSFLKLLTMKVL